MARNTIVCGDALTVLCSLPTGHVQTVVTSPPYYSLRDYGVDGQIGLEETPAAYVAKLVEVFREVRRVLRSDGTVWCNLGDSYAGGGPHHGDNNTGKSGTNRGSRSGIDRFFADMKPKNLLGIPWRVAFALQDDGWILRSDVIWHKTNAMPESVTDRPTKAHEYVFLLSKSERYFYDSEAIAEPCITQDGLRGDGGKRANNDRYRNTGRADHFNHNPSGRNKRSVWSIPTSPFPGSHFAVMPPKLAETCILAGSSQQACEHCGAPWQRVTTHVKGDEQAYQRPKHLQSHKSTLSMSGGAQGWIDNGSKSTTTGWQQTCACTQEGTGRCIVLDPFMGAGTTALVARQQNRDYLGIELNPEYIKLIEKRLDVVQPVLWTG